MTDYVALDGADRDSRMTKALERGLTQLDSLSLEPVSDTASAAELDASAPEIVTLPRGGVTDLAHSKVTVTATWTDQEHVGEVDVVAFVTDLSDAVDEGHNFCFYNQPSHPAGLIDLDLDTVGQGSADVDAASLAENRRITIAAAIDGTGTFGDLGAVELTVRTPDGSPLVRSTLDAASDETSMLLAQVYWRNGRLRFRSVGQGYQRRLGALAVGFGVDIEDTD
ncbi:TerD family protein [Yimella sp. cx-573]|nr:TerD family protein [Yimella sp. cx-573]